jgi:hypothetical protein
VSSGGLVFRGLISAEVRCTPAIAFTSEVLGECRYSLHDILRGNDAAVKRPSYLSVESLKAGRSGRVCRGRRATIWPLNSFRPHQLGDSPCKLCGGTRRAVSLLWVSDRIDSNHCSSTADLSDNGCARISKICEALVFEKSVVWTFTHGAISNDGRQIAAISSVTDLHSRGRIDNAKFVARCGPYRNRFR